MTLASIAWYRLGVYDENILAGICLQLGNPSHREREGPPVRGRKKREREERSQVKRTARLNDDLDTRKEKSLRNSVIYTSTA
jgi:hypothetical protein